MGKPVIGLTGPTGAGKSTVAAALKRLGCAVVDADQIAREIVGRGECLRRLKKAFGEDIAPEGNLDRQILARRAFSDSKSTALLNSITHPAVIAEAKKRIGELERSGCRAVVLDAPLLFESGTQDLCSAVIAVVAPYQVRMRRIMDRDRILEDAARERMSAQHSPEYYLARSDYFLDGSHDRKTVERNAAFLLEKITGDAG